MSQKLVCAAKHGKEGSEAKKWTRVCWLIYRHFIAARSWEVSERRCSYHAEWGKREAVASRTGKPMKTRPGGCNRTGEGLHIPCFCMTWRNLTMTLELGRMRTWRLPAFSALFMLLRASWRTEVRTILAVWKRFSSRGSRNEVSEW